MSPVIQSKIESVRRKHALIAAIRGFAAIVGAAILLLAVGMLVDWWLELPRWARAALLALDVTVLMYIVLWQVVAPIVWGPDDEEIALMVEREWPEFRTRLIASVQLGRPSAVAAGTSRPLVEAMIGQTERVAEPLDFTEVVKTDAMLKTAVIAMFIVLLGGSAFVYGGEVSSDLLARAFLSNIDVPRNTRVIPETQDLVVAIGDSVTLEALANGVVPASGTVRVTYASGRDHTFAINPAPDNTRKFSRTIENVQESFKYRIALNDGHGKWHNVTAIPRPAVVSVDFIQEYPAYTRQSPQRRSPGDLTLLAGSKLNVKLKSSKAVKGGKVQLVGLERSEELVVEPGDATMVGGSIEVPSKGLTGLSFRLTDEHGIQSRGETVYPVDVALDKDPLVRITWPDRKEELATQQARVLVAFEATDDFGVAKVILHYQVQGAEAVDENLATRTIELDLSQEGGGPMKSLRRRHEFDLGSLRPLVSQGHAVEYWLEVRDGNDVTGPGRSYSDHFRVRIVSELEKRADLMNRINDQFGTIDAVTTDQEKLNQNLGALIHAKPISDPKVPPGE